MILWLQKINDFSTSEQDEQWLVDETEKVLQG
jgi:hypothetical protein